MLPLLLLVLDMYYQVRRIHALTLRLRHGTMEYLTVVRGLHTKGVRFLAFSPLVRAVRLIHNVLEHVRINTVRPQTRRCYIELGLNHAVRSCHEQLSDFRQLWRPQVGELV